ncbi:MAG: hypothetical protein PHY30_03740, partial [Candidatus Pacebacteria bacterium]|nr:hypothetical protein [Candidatus Paceibacterota bacterium]
MPSQYNTPINTSENPQTKKGDLTFTMMYGFSTCNENNPDCSYYINPSGDSVVSGTISAANPTGNEHVATKGYVDGLFGNVEKVVSSSNLVYVTGINPPCPEDSVEIMRHYLSKTCGWDSLGCSPSLSSCQTVDDIWVTEGHIPSCTYRTTPDICANLYTATCIASDSDAVICAKTGTPLFNNYHTEEQCRIWNGEPVTVEDSVRICKFSSAICPGGWNQYKSWSTTVPGQSPFPISSSEPGNSSFYYTGSHDWSNADIESSYCNRCIGLTNNNEFCGTNDNCSNRRYYYYASVTEIGCY